MRRSEAAASDASRLTRRRVTPSSPSSAAAAQELAVEVRDLVAASRHVALELRRLCRGDLAGQLSALLFSQAWPPVRLADMGGVVLGVLREPGAPATAWPHGSAQLIPGPVAFWGTFAVVTVLPASGVLWLRLRVQHRRRAGEPQTATWASRSQLRPLIVKQPTAGRVTLGYAGRDLLAAEPRQSVIVIGPSQSGKTTGLAIPALLEWDGPVIATSVKQDLLADSIAAAASAARFGCTTPPPRPVSAARVRSGRRWPGATPGRAPSAPPPGWSRPAATAACRRPTSGTPPPASCSPRCCSPLPPPAAPWPTWSAGSTPRRARGPLRARGRRRRRGAPRR